jgi:3-hydroxyacyl-CoA dehydrogenase
MGNINAVTNVAIEDGVGVVTVNSPPVNALSAAVREGLYLAFPKVLADPAAKAVILICEGRTFFAGADISEFGKPDTGPSFAEVLAAIENATKPVIAAIHGTALGGGYEVALTCHYRTAVPSAKVGLPEVNLGLLPGAGGTQRLPRIVGAEVALDLITSGRPVPAGEGHKLGMVDELVGEGKLLPDSIAFAKRLLAQGRPLKRVRDLSEKMLAARGRPEIFAEFRRANARRFRSFKAPENIIKCIEAAVNLPFDQGMQREAELFQELLTSSESQAQRYVFFAEREVAKIPDIDPKTPTLPVNSVGVIGAGTMGGGIAMNFLNIGVPVTLVETKQEALDRGVATIRKNYENTAKRGKMNPADVGKRMALLKPTLELQELTASDLIIEAVFEKMQVKQEVFGRLESLAKPGAILATNTSFLDIDTMAAVTSRPQQVIGMHFFSPANVMRLLEVVRGAKTSKEVIATAMQLGRKIGKIAVLSRNAHGFIANHIMHARGAVTNEIVLEGPLPWDIDRVMVDFGFPMGPFAMYDLVGLDVVDWDPGTRGETVQRKLLDLGRWGQKKNAGYYDYDADRKASPSPTVEKIIRDYSAKHGIQARKYSDADILALLLYPVVNEGAKILEAGVAIRASDIDIALIQGYAWPVYTGGPMFWAGQVGLKRIVEQLKTWQAERGDFYKPAPLLEKLAAAGKTF